MSPYGQAHGSQHSTADQGYDPPASGRPGYGQPGHGSLGYGQLGAGPQGYGSQGYGSQGYGPPPGHPQQRGRPSVGAPLSEGDENLWALLAHLSVPFLGFVGPLAVYLAFRDRSRWLAESALEALNFSILYTLVVIASGLLTVLLIGFALLPVAFVASVVLAVLAAVASNRHELYRYPVNWRLVR